MTKKGKVSYSPDYAVPPGDILAETMEARNMTLAQLAEQTGVSEKSLLDIVRGRSAITSSIANKLFEVLGVPASLWLNLERNYQKLKPRSSLRAVKGERRSTSLASSKPVARAV